MTRCVPMAYHSVLSDHDRLAVRHGTVCRHDRGQHRTVAVEEHVRHGPFGPAVVLRLVQTAMNVFSSTLTSWGTVALGLSAARTLRCLNAAKSNDKPQSMSSDGQSSTGDEVSGNVISPRTGTPRHVSAILIFPTTFAFPRKSIN